MKTINKLILKYGLSNKHRSDIKTTCDLYFNLFSGYLVIIIILGILSLYLTGMYNFISLDKEIGAMIFYRTYEGAPSDFKDVTMALSSVIHILLLFALCFFLLIKVITFFVLGMIWVWSQPKMQLIFSSIEMPKLWCRKLTEEEIQKIKQI